jgi:multiple sugar transport system permease protein
MNMAVSERNLPKERPILRMTQLRREALWGILLAAPAVLGFILWQFGPMVASLVIGFTDWKIVGTPHWIGFENFQRIFNDRLFYQALRVTVLYSILSVPLGLLTAFSIALLLNQKVRGLPIFRTIYYIPSIVPVVASSVLWIWLYNPDFGLLNAILRPMGFPKLQWIYATNSVIPSLVLMSLWSVGGMMLIFLAGLQGVPRHLYEAVEIDGGGPLRKLIHVTLPMMTPTIFFNLILSTINALQTFTQGYIMTNGGPNNASLFYALYIYRKAFHQTSMGYASALAWILFLIILALSYFLLKSSSSWVYYHGDR